MNKNILILAALALSVACSKPSATTASSSVAAITPQPTAASMTPQTSQAPEPELPAEASAGFAAAVRATPPPAASSVAPAPAAPSVAPAPAAPMPAAARPFPVIDADETAKALASGEAVLVDVRGAYQYQSGHAAGAIHIPYQEIFSRSVELPQDKLIVLYCTCPAEESSGAAAMELQMIGFEKVAALRGGLDAWIQAGQQIVKQ